MHRRITEQSTVTTATDEIARALDRLTDERGQVRQEAIRTLAALTRLPEADPAPVVAALAALIRTDAIIGGVQLTPDVHAALSLLGTLPHEGGIDLSGIRLIDADLSGLDFSQMSFRQSKLIKIKATTPISPAPASRKR